MLVMSASASPASDAKHSEDQEGSAGAGYLRERLPPESFEAAIASLEEVHMRRVRSLTNSALTNALKGAFGGDDDDPITQEDERSIRSELSESYTSGSDEEEDDEGDDVESVELSAIVVNPQDMAKAGKGPKKNKKNNNNATSDDDCARSVVLSAAEEGDDGSDGSSSRGSGSSSGDEGDDDLDNSPEMQETRRLLHLSPAPFLNAMKQVGAIDVEDESCECEGFTSAWTARLVVRWHDLHRIVLVSHPSPTKKTARSAVAHGFHELMSSLSEDVSFRGVDKYVSYYVFAKIPSITSQFDADCGL